jgi:Na+-driven multidrug efflux pump/anti-sigma regulatory factor (Ser/Thr protein kinase)
MSETLTEAARRTSNLVDSKYRQFFFASMLTTASVSMSVFVDGILVGNMINSSGLAAVNLVMPVTMLYTTLVSLLGVGASSCIAVKKGQRSHQEADEIFTASLFFALVFSLLLTVLQKIFLNEIVGFIVKDVALRGYVGGYLGTLLYLTPFIVFVSVLMNGARTEGLGRLTALVLVAANLLNLVCDYIFMGPLGLGIAGAAAATITGYVVSLFLSGVYVFSKNRTLRFKFSLLEAPRLLCAHLLEIVSSGFPAAMAGLLLGVRAYVINTLALAAAGSAGAAAYSVYSSASTIAYMFIMAAVSTMCPLAGTFYGEMDAAGVRFSVKKALRVILTATVFIAAFFCLFPNVVMRAYGVTEPSFAATGAECLRIASVSFPLIGLANLFIGYYMAVRKKRLAASLSILEGIAFVAPLAFVLERTAGAAGLWWSLPLSEAATVLAGWLLYKRENRRAGGRYSNMLMLEPVSDCRLIDFSVENNVEKAVAASHEAEKQLRTDGIANVLAAQVAMAVEEMCVNICRYGYRLDKKCFIDVRIRVMADNRLVISIRDDGVCFNPLEYRNEEESEGYLVGGIEIVKAMAEKVSYDRILDMNNTTIILNGRPAPKGGKEL